MSTCADLRCSSDAQDTLRQREAIEHSKMRIDHWLEDHQSRDKASKRPDFQRLLKAVQAGQVHTIVVASLDRFGVKDAYEMGKFFTILRDHNCRLLDATGKHLNADDDATVLTSTIGALTSSREQKEKAGRVLTGKLTLARKGNFLGGYVPYGMDVVCSMPKDRSSGVAFTRATTNVSKSIPMVAVSDSTARATYRPKPSMKPSSTARRLLLNGSSTWF
jgi:DNA invertase Pin-like site-specific DNA recombinase